MSYFVYQFEAVFIQDYLLSGGKLKTLVGASELLGAVTNELLEQTIGQFGLSAKQPEAYKNIKGELNLADGEVIFPRRAGGVFMMVCQNEKTATSFAQLWPILVSQFAPGLRFSAALATDEQFSSALEKVRKQLNEQKNLPLPNLPEATPVSLRMQKTGLVQVGMKGKNLMDWTMPAKLNHTFKKLAENHLPSELKNKYTFPQQFEHSHLDTYWKEAFPFKSTDPGNHTVAIIHADGNGLGGYLHQIFDKLKKMSAAEYIYEYAQFSTGLDKATKEAAKSACLWLIQTYDTEENPYKSKSADKHETPLPMRPIILGGDDLTCIVRADYAFGFISAFTQAFEAETRKAMTQMKALQAILPPYLSCTTGMVFLRSNQPFSLGYSLAADLCDDAKKTGRTMQGEEKVAPSLINFLYTTSTLFEDGEKQVARELQAGEKMLSCMPYAFFEGRNSLRALFALSEFFEKDQQDKLKISTLRTYATYLHQDPAYAQVMWNRWAKQSNEKSQTKDTWLQFEQAFDALSSENKMPVADLIALKGLEAIKPAFSGVDA